VVFYLKLITNLADEINSIVLDPKVERHKAVMKE
jgi:hypothetical protein